MCNLTCQREWAEGNKLPFSYINCGKNCLCHLFDGNVWSTSSEIVFLEEKNDFGPAADVFGWRNSNLKLHLVKKPVHNFVCFPFLFFFFFTQLSWNKLPTILCSVQVSRLPFTHTHLCSPSASWGLCLKFCLRVYTAVVLAELQWVPCAPTGCSIPLKLNNWVLHSRSPHMGSTARNRQKKAAEIVNCYLIPVAVVPRSIKTLLGGSDSLLWNRGSVLLVFAVINLSGFFLFVYFDFLFFSACVRGLWPCHRNACVQKT